MTRLRRLFRAPDDGLTLTELVVGMAITALALMLVGTFFANIMQTTTNGRVDRLATGAAANAIDEIGRVVRAGAPVTAPDGSQQAAVVAGSTSSSLTVISYVDVDPANPVPSQVVFTVDGSGNLVETRTLGVQTGSAWAFTGAITTRVFTGPLTVGFQYWSDSGTAAAPTAVTPSTNVLGLTVTSMTVTVTAPRSGWGTSTPVVLTTTATMPNTTTSS